MIKLMYFVSYDKVENAAEWIFFYSLITLLDVLLPDLVVISIK